MQALFESKTKGAEFSPCNKHRNKLWRIWDEDKPLAMCIGLNPSDANADKDDPTIRILKGMLSKLGYGGFYMMNLFTIISSDPKILKTQTEWADWLKDRDRLIEVSRECQDVIFAWGNFKEAQGRSAECVRQFPSGKCFGWNANGTPFHPMAMMYNGKQGNPGLFQYK